MSLETETQGSGTRVYACATCRDLHQVVVEGGDYRDPADAVGCPDCPLNEHAAAALELRTTEKMHRAGWILGPWHASQLTPEHRVHATESRHEFYQLALAKGYVTPLECQKLAAFFGNTAWFGSVD